MVSDFDLSQGVGSGLAPFSPKTGGGTLTNGTAIMTDVAIVNESISLIAAFELTLNHTSFDSATTLFFNNPSLVIITDFGTATNNGFMGYGFGTGEVDLYLTPSGGSVSFVNTGRSWSTGRCRSCRRTRRRVSARCRAAGRST
jgi:hypothetical protein